MERFAKVNELLAEYESLEAQMADPSIHADQNKARALGKRYAQLGPVIAGYRAYKLAEEDLIAGMQQLYWKSYYFLEIQMMIVM
jgi:peptide chain release factor 1